MFQATIPCAPEGIDALPSPKLSRSVKKCKFCTTQSLLFNSVGFHYSPCSRGRPFPLFLPLPFSPPSLPSILPSSVFFTFFARMLPFGLHLAYVHHVTATESCLLGDLCKCDNHSINQSTISHLMFLMLPYKSASPVREGNPHADAPSRLPSDSGCRDLSSALEHSRLFVRAQL